MRGVRQPLPAVQLRRRGRLLIQRTISFGLLVLTACGLTAPTRGELLSPQGDTGPVAIANFERRVRHTDLLDVEVVFPANEDGSARSPAFGSFWPSLVLLQGGQVPVSEYRWLAQAMAEAGYVVALPHHALDLPILEVDNASVARDLLAFPPQDSLLEGLIDRDRIGLMGHSLGGVVAVKSALSGGYGAVALLASFPDGADEPRFVRTTYPTLLLAGGADCQVPPSRVLDEARGGVPTSNAVVTLEGVSHLQFTGEGGGRACGEALPLDVAHTRIVAALTVFFREAMIRGVGVGVEKLEALEGTTVEVIEGTTE